MSKGKLIVELIDELRNSSEQKNVTKIRHFSISLEIFVSNYKELIHYLEIHNNPQVSLQLMNQDNRELLHQFQLGITRLLHNYIASSISLIDHTRNHYRELYGKNNLFPDYQEKIDAFFKDHSLSVFVKDFRQYIQHFSMPSLSTRLDYKQGAPDLEITMRISIDNLNEFSGWKSKSKEYISNLVDDLDILKMVNEHQKHIKEFYEWFISRQHSIHKSDYEKVNKIRAKIRNIEYSSFISKFIQEPTGIEEFEKGLFQFYNKKKISNTVKSSNPTERIIEILELIKNEEHFNKDFEKSIREVYK